MLELIKDYIKMTKVIAVPKSRSVFEHDCIVPDALPDMQKVLVADGVATVDRVSVQKDAVTVDFDIHYKVLYLSDSADAAIKSINTVAKHSVTLDAPGVDQSTMCSVDCAIEHTDHTFINSRKLAFRSVVKIDPHLTASIEKGITTGLDGLSDIQIQKNTFKLSSLAESQTTQLTVSENLELPSGKVAFLELLRVDPRISDIIVAINEDKLQVKGNLNVCALYVADDTNQNTQIFDNQIPFTQNIQISANDENVSWDVNTKLKSFMADLQDDSDGDKRILAVNAIITFSAGGYETKECDIMTDAYSLTKDFNLETENIAASLKVGDFSTQFVLKEVIAKPEDAPVISEIISVTGQVGQADTSEEAGNITIEGFIITNVLYMSEDPASPIGSFTQQIPFSQTFEQKYDVENPDITANLDVSHASFSILSPQEIELRIAVAVKTDVTCINNIATITNAVMPDESDKDLSQRPSILLYIVQPGDTLWKIAKRYSAPIAILQNVNELKNTDGIRAGQKLLIPT